MSDATVSNTAGMNVPSRRVAIRAAAGAIVFVSQLPLSPSHRGCCCFVTIASQSLLLLYLGAWGTVHRATAGSGHGESSKVWQGETDLCLV